MTDYNKTKDVKPSDILEKMNNCLHQFTEISNIQGIKETCYNYKCLLCNEHRLEYQNIVTGEITATDIYIEGDIV